MVPKVNFVVVAPTAQFTWEANVGSEFEMKLLPVNEMLRSVAGPAPTALGLTPVSAGTGFFGGLMLNANGLERPFCPAP
jgi:hypothetical protein